MCGVMAAVRVGQIGIRDSFASLFRGFFPSLSIARIMISLGEGKEEGGIKCELFFPTLRNASAFLREPTLLASPGSNISPLPNLVCQKRRKGRETAFELSTLSPPPVGILLFWSDDIRRNPSKAPVIFLKKNLTR